MKQTFEYGKYRYDYYVEFSDRKTFGLMVTPEMRIIAKVPYGATLDDLERLLKRKWLWLRKQLDELLRYQKTYREKQYVPGEAFRYLGRQYTLLVEQGAYDGVKFRARKLVITTTQGLRDGVHNQAILNAWYERRTAVVFKQQYIKAFRLFDYEKMPQLRARVMTRRWGSYTQDNKIALNPKLIQAPTEAIHYVIVHELCHVTNRKHDELFYKELENRIPNWREVKDRLEIRYG